MDLSFRIRPLPAIRQMTPPPVRTRLGQGLEPGDRFTRQTFPPVFSGKNPYHNGHHDITTVAHPETGDPVLYSHYTGLFRDGVFHGQLADYLIRTHPNGTTIYDYAASRGAEAITTALTLIDRLGPEQARKFHIIASDKFPRVLDRAKQGIIGEFATNSTWVNMAHRSDAALSRFLSDYIDPQPLGSEYDCFKATSGNEILFRVRPHIQDILEEMITWRDESVDFREVARHPFEKNALVMFRNVFYLLDRDGHSGDGPSPQDELIEDLKQNMPDGSHLIIGASEYLPEHNPDPENTTPQRLAKAGFLPVEGFNRLGRSSQGPTVLVEPVLKKQGNPFRLVSGTR